MRRAAAVVCLLLTALSLDRARAADWPDVSFLRGSLVPDNYVRWDGLNAGVQLGYSNLTVNFADATNPSVLPQSTTNSAQFGAFIGYNFQWDNLVLGVDGAYNRPSSLSTSVASGATSSSLKLVDYGTFRGRAGYAFGQFLPYGILGAAVGRMNFATVAGVGTAITSTASRDNAYSAGFVAGVGIDVSVLPNVFVRGEYEYIAFSPVGSIRSSLNSARVGLGIRF